MSLDDRIRLAASRYLGWRYGHMAMVAEHHFAGVDLALAEVGVIDCSTFTAAVLSCVYPSAGWDREDYADLQIYADRVRAGRRAAPVDAVVRRGVGVRVDALGPGSPEWYLCQGWRGLPSAPTTGHAFLVRDEGGGECTVLASSSVELRGPRWRVTRWVTLLSEYRAALYRARLE